MRVNFANAPRILTVLVSGISATLCTFSRSEQRAVVCPVDRQEVRFLVPSFTLRAQCPVPLRPVRTRFSLFYRVFYRLFSEQCKARWNCLACSIAMQVIPFHAALYSRCQ